MPDLSFISAVPPAARVAGYLGDRANCLLMTGNIMDLSHPDYPHPDTPGGGINSRIRDRVEQAERTITIRWHADGERLPPVQDAALPVPGEAADFRNAVTWHPPA